MHQSNRTFEPAFARMVALASLDEDAQAALAEARWVRTTLRAGGKIDAHDGLTLLVSGWATRCRLLSGGRQQLLSVFLPGDLCSYAAVTGPSNRTTLLALTPVTVFSLDASDLLPLAEKHPSIMRAILYSLAIDRAIGDEHIVRLGSCTALARIAHFLCELGCRLSHMGMLANGSFEFPLTQPQLGEYLSLSSVHVNRTLQSLRRAGLVETSGSRLTVLDAEGLRQTGGFNPAYLGVLPSESAPAAGAAAPPQSPGTAGLCDRPAA